MIYASKPSLYVGCSTDSRYVDMTGTLLSSLDDNGEIPEATVLVADFGLNDKERRALCAAAGRLGSNMRFIPISEDSPKIVARSDFHMPLPLLGRFILPREVKEKNARLLLLDSDIIINSSLRPMCYIDMRAHAVAAVFNPIPAWRLAEVGRGFDPGYLNAGVMLLDVDVFNSLGLGEACMRRLAQYSEAPMWLDNDAIVDVLKGNWLRLNRCWNFFYASDEFQFTETEYATVPVLHFAGAKPGPDCNHPAMPIFNHHAARAAVKMQRSLIDGK